MCDFFDQASKQIADNPVLNMVWYRPVLNSRTSDTYLLSEQSQALVRCGVATVVMIILGYLALNSPATRAGGLQAMMAVGVFWVIAVIWTVWVWRSRQSYRYRRLGGLIFDITGTTLAFILAEELSAFFYPVYQWIIIGHGIRYGKQAIVMASGLSVVGFGVAIGVTPYWQENILVASGLIIGLVILPMYLFALIQKLHELNTRLQTELSRTYHAATHDQLTGISNRQYFHTRLGELIDESKKNGHCLAVMFIDLDEFKAINDELGHSAGDEVLQIVAERLRWNCRDQDVISRFGGDEFSLIITDTNTDAVESTAKRILKSIREPISINDRLYQLGGSIGISVFPEHGQTPDELTHNADVAMYEAKRKGKNAYVYYANALQA